MRRIQRWFWLTSTVGLGCSCTIEPRSATSTGVVVVSAWSPRQQQHPLYYRRRTRIIRTVFPTPPRCMDLDATSNRLAAIYHRGVDDSVENDSNSQVWRHHVPYPTEVSSPPPPSSASRISYQPRAKSRDNIHPIPYSSHFTTESESVAEAPTRTTDGYASSSYGCDPVLRNDTATLWSYVYNLQRARRTEQPQQQQQELVKKSARSLAHFLQSNTYADANCDGATQRNTTYTQHDDSTTTSCCIVEPLQRAVVQAIRGLAGGGGGGAATTTTTTTNVDYRLILQLYNGALHYATHHHSNYPPILDPQIAGETIAALGRCTPTVNLNKIRSVWNTLAVAETTSPISNSTAKAELPNNNNQTSAGTIWTRAVGPFEVNAMLQVLVSRGKLTAAVDLFHKELAKSTVLYSATDAYSVSILLNALLSSVTASASSGSTHLAIVDERNMGQQQARIPVIENDELKVLWKPALCWQWKEAIVLLDRCITVDSQLGGAPKIIRHINNPVITSFLQLSQKVAANVPVHERKQISGISTNRIATWAIDFMKQNSILPDHVTSTLILSNLDSWEYAVTLLRSSGTRESSDDATVTTNEWGLPRPNVYMYSAVMALCARNQQYNMTVQLLNEMEHGDGQVDSTRPGVYLYNSILQALTGIGPNVPVKMKHSTRQRAQERLSKALELFAQMPVAPDRVTYNTLLAVVAGNTKALLWQKSANESTIVNASWNAVVQQFPQYFEDSGLTMLDDEFGRKSNVHLVTSILNDMNQRRITPDAMTYKHAIQAVGNSGCAQSICELVRRYISEIRVRRASSKVQDTIVVCNAALSEMANIGNIEGMTSILSLLKENGVSALNSDGIFHVIKALEIGHVTVALPYVLTAAKPSETLTLSTTLEALWRMDLPSLESLHWATAIGCCLRVNDFESARQLLDSMRASGMGASDVSLELIASTYAKLALEYDTPASALFRSNGTDSPARASYPVRARSAYTIYSNVKHPTAALVSIVARACCSAGMFDETQSLLRILHKRVLRRRAEMVTGCIDPDLPPSLLDDNERVLPTLHRDLLKLCADHGNVTIALRLCEDIQYLSSQLSTASCEEDTPWTLELEGRNSRLVDDQDNRFGMTSPCWKALITAASKSGHWRVCLSSLQFLRPYLESSHPAKAVTKADLLRRAELYKRLEPTLSKVVKCLAQRSQYGWIVRVIDDWIEWCGRRPHKEAALAAIRILAARGRGEEVNSLLVRCTKIASSNKRFDDESYKSTLFVAAISALYADGLYDAADDAFVAAISQRALPFNLEKKMMGENMRITLDLHGMNVAVAHSAVRIALQQEAASDSLNWTGSQDMNLDMEIVTGRGLNSAFRMRPVLRPAVQRMLVEEFYPPLSTISVPGNMGAIRIPSEDIYNWLGHQKQQKGARLLIVAAMLRDMVSPHGRLRAALSKMSTRTALDAQ